MEYLRNERSFLEERKTIFHNFRNVFFWQNKKIEDTSFKFKYSIHINVDLVLVRRVKRFQDQSEGGVKSFWKQRVGVNFQDFNGFKHFRNGGFQFISGDQYFITCHELLQNSQSDKVCIVVMKFSFFQEFSISLDPTNF